jgi:hypothetical protein
MATETSTGMTVDSPTTGTVVRRGGFALAVSLVVNAALVFASDLAGVAPGLDPLSYGPVVLFTSLGVIGATVVYAALARFTATADRTFTILAVVLAVVSIVPDVTVVPALPGATTLGAVVLAVMHLTTAAACIAFLTDWRARRAAR